MFNKINIQLTYFTYSLIFCSPLFSQEIQVLSEEYPPYNYTKNNRFIGANTEIVRAVFDKVGLKYEIVIYPWLRTYKIALEQKNTLIYSIIRNEEREDLFQWVGVISPMQLCVFSLKSNKQIQINNSTDINKYTIITHRVGHAAKKLIEKGLSKKENIRETISLDGNLSTLLSSRVDLIASPILALNFAITKKGLQFENIVENQFCFKEDDLYMAFSLNTPENIVEKFRDALIEFKKEVQYQEIIHKYFK